MRCTLLLLPVVLLVLARPAWTEDTASQSGVVDPARVGRLLLSDDEDERARGAALLQRRMRQGGDVQTWLVAMARAQTEWADAEDRLVERWIDEVLHGTPERAAKARRLLAAVGREATRRLLAALRDVQRLVPQVVAGQERAPGPGVPQLPTLPLPESFEPPPPPPVEGKELVQPEPAPPPIGMIRGRVVDVPREELLRSLASDAYGVGSDRLEPLVHDRPVLVEDDVAELFERSAALPEARLREGRFAPLAAGPGVPLVEGDVVRYRSRARRTKAAWAVDTATLLRGLRVTVRVVPMDDANQVQIEARYVSLPDPLPTEQVRPADDVEPLELDRPEWEAASMRVSTVVTTDRKDVVVFFPGLVPDRIVVVQLDVLPVAVPAAAREPAR